MAGRNIAAEDRGSSGASTITRTKVEVVGSSLWAEVEGEAEDDLAPPTLAMVGTTTMIGSEAAVEDLTAEVMTIADKTAKRMTVEMGKAG